MKTNVKTGSRIISIAIALAMALSVFCAVTAQPVSAASKSKVYNSNALYMGTAKDKDGSYYIWADPGYNGGQTLKCSKSASGAGKVLAKSKKKQDIALTAVTNGETIYFAIVDRSKKAKKTTFYKTTVNKKKPSKIKTVAGKCEPATYYKGKLYFVKNNRTLQACDVSKKTVTSVTSSFRIPLDGTTSISSYGSYIIRWQSGDGRYDSQYLYNVASKKETELPEANKAVVYGKNVYYYTYSGSNMVVKQCNLAGTGIKDIKNLKKSSEWNMSKKSLWFWDNKMKPKKLTYKTKKVTNVK